MKTQRISALRGIGRLAIAVWMFAHIPAIAQESDDYETMTRGPVHEAFAGTVAYDPEPGILVKKAPPAAIEELPPEQQLEGDNVVWIPGYWAWDDELGDFLWVSGVWRNLPPGREWVPGYWNPVDGQYQWISGYWAETESTEVAYLPPPPKSLETGPNIEALTVNHVWLPGNWVYRQNRYVWRSGYWAEPRPDWVYIPAHYIWTPRGYIFVAGYWDYAVPRRGVVFAPIYFHRPVYSHHGYRYSPSLVISLSVFTNHLFLRPRYCHYYFGDYYAPSYINRGFYATYDYHRNRRGYDPIYVYERWNHRDDRRWDRNLRERYERLRERESDRPPHTWASMRTRKEYREGDRALATTLDRYTETRVKDGARFRKVDKTSREKMVEQNRKVRDFSLERQRLESRNGKKPAEPGNEVRREKRDKSPILSRAKSEPLPAVTRPKPDQDKAELTGDDDKLPKRDGKRERTNRKESSIPPTEETTPNRDKKPRIDSPKRPTQEVTPPARDRDKAPGTETPEGKETEITPDNPKPGRDATPRPDRKERVEPPSIPRTERKERVEPPTIPLTERKERVETPTIPRVERKERVEPPSIPRTERKERVEPPSVPRTERKERIETPSIPRVERRERVEPPAVRERTRESVPRVERRERVEPPVVRERNRESAPRIERDGNEKRERDDKRERNRDR